MFLFYDKAVACSYLHWGINIQPCIQHLRFQKSNPLRAWIGSWLDDGAAGVEGDNDIDTEHH